MIAVIFNPAAGRGRVARAQLQRRLQAATGATDFEIAETSPQIGARELATTAIANGAKTVVAAGGDGTLGEVLGAVYGTGAQLAVLPLGTGNDFARTLGIGADLDFAITTLVRGHCRTIDIGRALYGEQSRLFLNIAGCGFDSLVARRINARRAHPLWRRVGGVAAYLAASFLELQRLRAARLRLHLDGELIDERALLCAVANARSYGGGMKVAPDAQLDDGLFDICVLKEATRLEFMRAFPGVFKGSHIHHERVEMFRARRVEMWCDRPWPVLVDGELWGTPPIRFEIMPNAIEIVAPERNGRSRELEVRS